MCMWFLVTHFLNFVASGRGGVFLYIWHTGEFAYEFDLFLKLTVLGPG